MKRFINNYILTYTKIMVQNRGDYTGLSKNELILIIERLRLRCGLGEGEVLSLVDKTEIRIPVSIFSENVSSLEIICNYLVEIKKLSYSEIAKLINRDASTVYQAYNGSRKKKASPKLKEGLSIPLSVLSDRRFSVLESIVIYLKEELNLKNHQIALILKRNDKTIWTVYNRAVKKKK